MRQVKFRAWDKKNKRMGFEDLTFAVGRMSERAESAGYVLMQFTGLLDKNGKEIYEGDVVRAHYFGFNGNETDEEIIGEIRYKEDEICFVIENSKMIMLVQNTTHLEEPCIEVIGNIYENSELLK